MNVSRSARVWLTALLLCSARSAAGAQEPALLPGVDIRAKPYVRTWPDTARQAVRDRLAAARVRWSSTRPERYELAVQLAPSWILSPYNERWKDSLQVVRVRGDSVVGVVVEHGSHRPNWTPWSVTTVEGIFAYLEAQLADTSRKVDRLELDSVFGYPKLWHTDDAQNGYGRYRTHQATAGEVALFRGDAPHAACRWWRRLLRDCE